MVTAVKSLYSCAPLHSSGQHHRRQHRRAQDAHKLYRKDLQLMRFLL
jgi:hypothetical protein